MSPFAAGCAVCGTDLDIRRWDAGPGPLARLGSRISAFSYGPSNTRLSGPMVLVVVFCAGTIISAVAAVLLYLFGVIGV